METPQESPEPKAALPAPGPGDWRLGPPWVVLKFGGTSVASAARWERIADILRRRRAAGERPLVVCSAVAGVSDLLETLLGRLRDRRPLDDVWSAIEQRHRELASDLGVEVDDLLAEARGRIDETLAERNGHPLATRERPPILALGELLSTAVGARWLNTRGLATRRMDARDLLEALPAAPEASPEQCYLDARCDHAQDPRLRRELEAPDHDVVLTQGFIARSPDGETVLLGRGGSDTAAAYLAARLNAERLEIWTDVPGLFSCNPRLVPHARFLPQVGYDEAECLAGFGAQVLHPRTLHPVRQARIPCYVKWTERPDLPGTRICDDALTNGLKAVVSRDNVCMVVVEKPCDWKPVGVLADVTTCFKESAIPIDLVTSSPRRIRLLVDLSVAGSRERLPHLLEQLNRFASARVEHDAASVTLVGRGLDQRIEDLAPALTRLAGERVRMVSHCATELSFTVVVEEEAAEGVVTELHREFFEDEPVEERASNDASPSTTWRDLVEAGPKRGAARTPSGASA